MLKKNYLWKILIIIPIILFYNINMFLTQGGIDLSINEMLAGALFGATTIGDIKVYALVIEKLFFILIFNMLFGTYIYQDFLISSVYLFSRLKDRKKWFYKKFCEIFIFAMMYSFLLLITLLVICILCSNYKVNADTFEMLTILFILITMFLTATTVLINLIAISFNSSTAFMSIYIILIALIALALKSDVIAFMEKMPYLMIINPVSAIILNISNNEIMRSVAMIYYFIINIIILILGAKYINKLEVGLLHNHES